MGREATSTKHGRDCCRTTWVCLQLQTSRLARLQRTKVTGAAQGPHVPRKEGPRTARDKRAGLQPSQRLRKASGFGGAGHACAHARPPGLAGPGLQL